MKVAAIITAGAIAGAGLLFLWQGGRGPANSPHQRGRRPAPAPSAEIAGKRMATPGEPGAIEAQGVSERAPRSVPVVRRPTKPAPALPDRAPGERKLLGAVLGDAGPLPGAHVLILARGEPVSEAETDELGRFEIAFPIPIEQAVLRIVARGYAPHERALGSPRQPGQEYLGNITIRRGSVLSGSVVDDAGRPVVGVEVGLGLWSGDGGDPRILEQTRTGPDGVFRFANAPSGRVNLTTRAQSWADQTTEHTHGIGQDARIELVRASTLRLLVHTPDGEPVPDATVQIQALDRRTTAREAKTDAAGRALFENLDSQSWSVRVNQPGYKPTGLPTAAADGLEHALTLVPWPCIAGRVLTPDKEPAPAETLIIAVPGGARGDAFRIGAGDTAVDAEGRFRICDLRRGSYLVRASAPGYAPTSSHTVQVGDSGDLDIGSIILLEGGTLALHLTVAGQPINGVKIEIHHTQPVPAQVWTHSSVPADTELAHSDAAGRAAIKHLGAGDVWLILRGKSTVPLRAGPFTIGEGRRNEPPAIELEPGTSVQGRVLTANGTPLAHARILVTGPAPLPSFFADEGGNFALPPLPQGTYRFSAQARTGGDELESAEQELELVAGQSISTLVLRFN